MRVFVDTGAWLAVVVATDRYHNIAVPRYEDLMLRRARLFTSDYVLDEAITRIRYDASHELAVGFLDLVHEAQRLRSLTVWCVDEEIQNAAEAIFRTHDDQVFSFTDCTSFALLQQAPLDEVFGFDQHFTMFGYNVRPLW